MTLSAWFACSELQLSARATANFLDIKTCIVDEHRAPQLTLAALESLEAGDLRLQVLAIPDLVSLLARGPDDRLRYAAARALSSVAGPVISDAALAGLAEVSDLELTGLLQRLHLDRTPRRLVGFADILESAPYVLALSLLRELVRRSRTSATDDADAATVDADAATFEGLLRGDDQPWYILAARQAELGRLALLVAIETMLLAGEPHEFLADELKFGLGDGWSVQPDGMRHWLLLELERAGLTDSESRASWLLEESINFRQYAGALSGVLPDEVPWLRLPSGDAPPACLVLWQSVCWELAAELAPTVAMETLARIWFAPSAFTSGVVSLNLSGSSVILRAPLERLARIRRPHKNQKDQTRLRLNSEIGRENSPAVLSFLFSPWLERSLPRYHAKDRDDMQSVNPKTFPFMDDNVAMLRLLANVRTFIALIEASLRARTAIPAPFLDLYCNAMDVLGNVRLRDSIQAMAQSSSAGFARQKLSLPVLGMALAASEHASRLGKGQLDPEMPALLVRHLELAAESVGDGERLPLQLHNLYRQAAFMAVAHLAFETFSGETVTDSATTSPWLDGGDASPMARLLRLILGRVWNSLVKVKIDPSVSVQESALLAGEAYPELLRASGRSWSWRNAYVDARQSIGQRLIFLSDPLSLDDWRALDPLDESRFTAGGALLAVTTERLIVAFATGKAGANVAGEWFEAWRELIDAVNLPRYLSRVQRQRLVQFLKRPAESETELDAQRAALLAVLEFSSQAVRYQDIAGSAIADSLGRGALDDAPPSPVELAAQWMYSMAAPAARIGLGAPGPWSLLGTTRTAVQRRETVDAFLGNVLSKRVGIPSLLGAVLRRIDEFQLTPNVAVAEAEVSLFSVLVFQRRKQGSTVALIPDRRDVASALLGGTLRGTNGRLGIVSGRRDTDQSSRTTVNDGGREPLEGPSAEWDLAKPVVVGTSTIFELPLAAGESGDTRGATVEWRDGSLTVNPSGRSRWSPELRHDHHLARWVPDSLDAVGEEHQAECVAVRQEDGAWLPLVRDFSRLVVDEFAAGQPEDVCQLVVVEELSTEPGWETSAGFGRHYAVPLNAMTEGLARALEDATVGPTGDDRSLSGLRVSVKLALTGGRPVLELADTGPDDCASIDDGNIRWRDRFVASPILEARRANGDWFIRGAASDGLPDVAVSFGLGNPPPSNLQTARVRVRAANWSPQAERSATVTASFVPDDRLEVSDWTDHETLASYLRAAEGAVFSLRHLAGESVDGYLTAVTREGLPLAVAAESLSLLPGEPPLGLVEGRTVVVQRLRHRRRTENRPAIACVLGTQLPTDRCVGVLARTTPSGSNVDVWFDVGGSSRLVTVPTSAFLTEIGRVGSHVEARASQGGFLMASSEVTIFTRAAWRVEVNGPNDGVPLAVAEVPDQGRRLVLQRVDVPVLFTEDPVGVTADRLTCGAPGRGKGRVKQVRRGFAMDEFGRPLDIVALATADGPLIGNSRAGAFRTAGPWLDARLTLISRLTREGVPWTDVRRDFVLGTRIHSLPAHRRIDGQPAEQVDEWLEGYEEWRDRGDTHAIAQFVNRDRASVLLNFMRLPSDPTTPSAGSSDVVRLQPGSRPWLRGRPYDQSHVRVRLAFDNRGWNASFADAESLTLQTFADEVLSASRHASTDFKMWYAGQTAEGHFRFEWGYGWFLEVKRDELDEDRIRFFFGDCLTNVRVVRRSVGDHQVLKLSFGSVHWEVERRVDEDARLGLLHQVKVRLVQDKSGKMWVNVLGVHTRTRTVRFGRTSRASTYEQIFNAKFDPASEGVILDQARMKASKDDTITVLARLDRSIAPGVASRRQLCWNVLTPDAADSGDSRLPREGESLVLTAGDIQRTGSDRQGNDFLIPFTLPGVDQSGVEDGEEPSFLVSVLRRQFSLRESTLRVAYSTDPREFRGTQMLVKLVSPDSRSGLWRGSVVSAPGRPESSLRDWAEADADHAYVVVGAVNKGEILVEPQPGVVGRITVGREKPPARMSTCKIMVDRGRAKLVVVVPGEDRYVPDNGRRAAHLLLKDDALFGRVRQGRDGGFTIAGLPGIEVFDRAAAKRARWDGPWRRLGYISRLGDRLAIEYTTPRVGRLESREPLVRPYGGSTVPEKVDWPQISFRDAPPWSIASHTRRGTWRYHDWRTGYFRGKEFHAVELPDPVRSKDGPLFFNDRWSLRYHRSELARYGYSATETLEYGLPEDDAWYPVAAPSSQGGLWVELSPGRVVEFRAPLLHSPATTGSSLNDFAWDLLASGDEVRLREKRSLENGIIAFVLDDWRPGPRGWFRDSRVLLEPSQTARGATVLGSGSGSLKWSGQLVGEEPIWLGPDNETVGFEQDVQVGDAIILTTIGKDQLGVHGWPALRVHLDSDWGSYEWMRDQLANPGTIRDSLFDALGGGIVVRVTSTDSADSSVGVGPTGAMPSGSRLAGRLLGVVDHGHAIFRGGSTLLLLPLSALLPGVPAGLRVAVARQLVQQAELVWLVRDGESWVSPDLPTQADSGFEVQIILSAPGGLVGVNLRNLALMWVPLSELGWLGFVPPELVFDVVKSNGGSLVAEKVQPGVASFLRTPEGRRVANTLATDDVPRAVPRVLMTEDGGQGFTYLATILPTIALIKLTSEMELTIGEPIPVEITDTLSDRRAVPLGQSRTQLHLSPWVVAGLRDSRVTHVIDVGRFRAHANKHLEPFKQAGSKGVTASSTVEERLVAVLAARVTGSRPVEDRAARTLIGEWMRSVGGTLLAGRPIDAEATSALAWDLAPLLSGVLLLADLGAVTCDGDLEALAVHGAHILGMWAAGAQHQEVLLRDWLLRPAEAPSHGRWARLACLDLGGRSLPRVGGDQKGDLFVTDNTTSDPAFDGQLSNDQLGQLRSCCRGILETWSEPDPTLKATARSLLFATERIDDPEALWGDLQTTQLASLNILGRALAPGREVAVCQSRLTSWQLGELSRMLHDSLRGDVPLTLLPDDAPKLSQRGILWAAQVLERLVRW